MWIILVYRPEAADGFGTKTEPFDGIEVLGLADTVDGANEMVDEYQRDHPDWHFMIEAVFKS